MPMFLFVYRRPQKKEGEPKIKRRVWRVELFVSKEFDLFFLKILDAQVFDGKKRKRELVVLVVSKEFVGAN